MSADNSTNITGETAEFNTSWSDIDNLTDAMCAHICDHLLH